jgi:hypothetical protein
MEALMLAQNLGLLLAGLVAGIVGGSLVYVIDKAFSRRQEQRYHHRPTPA